VADEAAAPLIEVEGLERRYGERAALSGVSFSIREGETLGLFGPNGAGKSTLLHTLVGLLPPLAGTAHYDGEPVDERAASFRREVSQVLDDDAFFPSLTGREHLVLTARGHGVVDADDVVAAELAAFGIEDRADALPSRLSSGQRRRLALAAAFVRPARLLVLDEPERRLDTDMRSALARRVAAERRSGLAVLFASHDADFVGAVAEQALVLSDDQCRLVGPERAAEAMTGSAG
jgi:ABC-2 type transport system ATP-binding protein